MNDFVDPRDPTAVEAVLREALAAIGVSAVVEQLAAVPDVQVQAARPGGLLRAAAPAVVSYGERRLSLDVKDGSGSLGHVVGGIVLATDRVGRAALPAVLASFVVRSLDSSGAVDEVSVLLTSLRDAVAASR